MSRLDIKAVAKLADVPVKRLEQSIASGCFPAMPDDGWLLEQIAELDRYTRSKGRTLADFIARMYFDVRIPTMDTAGKAKVFADGLVRLGFEAKPFGTTVRVYVAIWDDARTVKSDLIQLTKVKESQIEAGAL